MLSTIGLRLLYSFDNLANSSPLKPPSSNAAPDFVLANQHSGTRAELVRASQTPRKIPRITKIDHEPGTSELLGEVYGSSFAGFAYRDQCHRPSRPLRLGDQHGKPFNTSGPPDARRRR